MKHRMLVGAAALAGACATAARPGGDAAARWTLVSEDHEAEYFYDPGSVERLGGMIRLRMRLVIRPNPGGEIRSAIVQAEINCAEQSSSFRSFQIFGEGGAPLRSNPTDMRPDVQSIRYSSPEQALYRRYCPASLVRPVPVPPHVPMIVSPPRATPLPSPMAPPPTPPPPLLLPPNSFRPAVRAQWLTPLASLITERDYPGAALRTDAEGMTRVSLRVSRHGRVTACTVTESSGSSVLDAATCRILTARARFRPARDARGRRLADTVGAGVRWVIPVEVKPKPAAGEPQPPGEQS
jgi:TonB family protein